jgi:hypothetical protein
VTTEQLASDASAFLARSIQVLERTPAVLESLLRDLPLEWTHENEGPGTWSPYDVVGHLIHGERTDWMPRVRVILSGSNDRRFVPFDRFAHLSMDPTEPLASRLETFRSLRAEGLEELGRLRISNDDLEKTGVHPEFGDVTLRQLISTWVAHDLGHLVQITRVMAKQIKSDVGPWVQYLRVLQ